MAGRWASCRSGEGAKGRPAESAQEAPGFDLIPSFGHLRVCAREPSSGQSLGRLSLVFAKAKSAPNEVMPVASSFVPPSLLAGHCLSLA